MKFGETSKEAYFSLIEKEIAKVKKELDIEKQEQKRLPEAFQDKTRINELNNELNAERNKLKRCVNSYILGKYMFVNCGTQIKYGKFVNGKMVEKEMGQQEASAKNDPIE